MAFSIALAGKGGTGKTTLAGLLVKYMTQRGKTPILAVDADSNANFNEVLGIEAPNSLGCAREDMKKGHVPNGMTKDIFIEMRMEEAIIEGEGFDLIVMGQPEGAGCYCAANSLLCQFLDRLQDNYPYIVMDNEAGMEHISRLTTSNVDYLLVVTDPSRRGIQAAERINALSQQLNIGVKKSSLILNNAKQSPSKALQQIIQQTGLELLGTVPEDETIAEFDLKGRPTAELPEDNPALRTAFSLFDKIID